jgi:hypothetical protein
VPGKKGNLALEPKLGEGGFANTSRLERLLLGFRIPLLMRWHAHEKERDNKLIFGGADGLRTSAHHRKGVLSIGRVGNGMLVKDRPQVLPGQ